MQFQKGDRVILKITSTEYVVIEPVNVYYTDVDMSEKWYKLKGDRGSECFWKECQLDLKEEEGIDW